MLWLLRRSFWTVLLGTTILLLLTGSISDPSQLQTPEIRTTGDVQELAASPRNLALLLAPAVRLSANVLALVLASPVARRFQQHADHERPRGWWNPVRWVDRWRFTSALRTARWTSSIRRVARGRIGRAGVVVLVADIALLVTGIVLLPVTVMTFARTLS